MRKPLMALLAIATLGCGDPYPPPPEPADPELIRVIAAVDAWVASGKAMLPPGPTVAGDCDNAGPPACEWKASSRTPGGEGNIWKCRDVCGETFWMLEIADGSGTVCFTSSMWGYECNGFAP